MGKKSGWFRKLFGGKKSIDSPKAAGESTSKSIKDQNRLSFTAVTHTTTTTTNRTALPQPPENYSTDSPYSNAIDVNKHAIVVAAATAAVADAAMTAAKAAAEVVRLTNRTGRCTPTASVSGSSRYREVLAAIKVQSAFRAYLARRALRALKALVKLQALVRGHIVRKQTADMLRRMQALVRVQTRARASRSHLSKSSYLNSKPSLSHLFGPASPIKYEHRFHASSTKIDRSSNLKRCGSNSNTRDIGQNKAYFGSNWLDHWMKESLYNDRKDYSLKAYADNEETDKILEVDTWKPGLKSKQMNRTTFQTSHHVFPSDYYDQPFMPLDSPSKYTTMSHPNVSSGDALSLSSLKFPVETDTATLWTAENSPQVFSASSRPGSSMRRSPFTPTRSECTQSFFSGYSDHPNYMTNTESYRAKVRSQSAPRQRIEFERYGSTRRSAYGFSDTMTSSRRGSAPHADFRYKD